MLKIIAGKEIEWFCYNF